VIAIDTNIIVYARRAELPHHVAARAVLAGLANGSAPWAIPWPCLYEYVKVITNPRLFRPPDTLADALADVESLVASPSVVLLGHGPEHIRYLRRAAEDGQPIGGQIHDAHIVALALEHGVTELLSSDRDFRRFSTLAVRDPFATPRAGEARARYRTRTRRAVSASPSR
jgi:uncharacterized protein